MQHTIPQSAPPPRKRADAAAEINRLRAQVIELGEQVTDLTAALGDEQARGAFLSERTAYLFDTLHMMCAAAGLPELTEHQEGRFPEPAGPLPEPAVSYTDPRVLKVQATRRRMAALGITVVTS